MRRVIDPPAIAPPASAYHHAFLSTGVKNVLTVSGQLGEHPDGTCAETAAEQAELAWRNVFSILDATGMALENIVKVTSYIVGEENIDAYVEVHKRFVGEQAPPWTLVVVAALGRPQYLVEVDVLAIETHDSQ